MSVSVRPTGYDLLGGHFDLTSELKHEVPPYLPKAPPTYKLKPHVPHGHRLRAIADELSPGAAPDDTRLSGFDLTESIWSRDSDLTLDDLPLDSDSASSQSRSTTSSHWPALPLTPSTSRHSELQPSSELAHPLEPTPLTVQIFPAQEAVPDEPGSPAPAYSRDPLEFDPVLFASLDTQLRLRPFEAFEDTCWSCFSDSAPLEVAHSLPPRSASVSHHSSVSCTSLTVHSTYAESSNATILPPPLFPSRPPSQPPPAYPSSSKPLPVLPPPSPLRSTADLTQSSFLQNPPVAMAAHSPFVTLDNLPHPPASSGHTIQFIPVRAQARPRSKSVGGTRTVRRLTTAIARLRGRE